MTGTSHNRLVEARRLCHRVKMTLKHQRRWHGGPTFRKPMRRDKLFRHCLGLVIKSHETSPLHQIATGTAHP